MERKHGMHLATAEGLGERLRKMEKAIDSGLSIERADRMEENEGCLTTMEFINALKKGC